MPRPAFSIILPVYERDATLRRALRSVLRQSLADFECVVVDDASQMDIASVVAQFDDPRLRYMRRETNGGPYAARFTGLSAARGKYSLFLDSDDELYPWALAQARDYLDNHPEVDLICALYVRNDDSRLFVRVASAPRIVDPGIARLEPPVPDRCAAVRQCVVNEWLQKDPGYFAMESHLFLTARLRHSQLYVDEPWMLYHGGGADRVTRTPDWDRIFRDYRLFFEEHQGLINTKDTDVVLDQILKDAFFNLCRHGGMTHKAERSAAAQHLRRRGFSPSRVLAELVLQKLLFRVPMRRRPSVMWVEPGRHLGPDGGARLLPVISGPRTLWAGKRVRR